jgi:hypothetical protein
VLLHQPLPSLPSPYPQNPQLGVLRGSCSSLNAIVRPVFLTEGSCSLWGPVFPRLLCHASLEDGICFVSWWRSRWFYRCWSSCKVGFWDSEVFWQQSVIGKACLEDWMDWCWIGMEWKIRDGLERELLDSCSCHLVLWIWRFCWPGLTGGRANA